MASTIFTDNSSVIYSSWLNDINTVAYTTVPAQAVSIASILTTLSTTVVAKDSSTGAASLPAGTTAERPTSLVTGQARYNTTTAKFEGYTGSTWSSLGGGATGGGSDTIFNENSTTMTASYSITSGKNAFMVGPLVVGSGFTLTVPTGSRLVVL